MKIRPVAAKLFHANRQTDRHDQANSRFLQFCEAPKNEMLRSSRCICVLVYSMLGWLADVNRDYCGRILSWRNLRRYPGICL